MSDLLEEMLNRRVPGPPEEQLPPLSQHAEVDGLTVLESDWSDAPLNLIRQELKGLAQITSESPVIAICERGRGRNEALSDFISKHLEHIASQNTYDAKLLYSRGCLGVCSECNGRDLNSQPYVESWGFAQDRVTGEWHLEIYNYRTTGTNRTSYSPNSSS